MNDYRPGGAPITEFDEEKRQLLEKKGQITVKKMDIQTKLMAIRNNIRRKGIMPKSEYDKILKTQERYKKDVVEVEKELVPIRNRLVEIANAEHLAYAQRWTEKAEANKWMEVFASPVIVQDLVSLRQHYQEFAADLTRVSSMRQMAADFVLKLSRIIKDDLKRPLANADNGNENRK